MMAIQVLSPGFLCSVQDEGRFGFEKFGVPASGPMDGFALKAANLLVDNPAGAACVEFGVEGPSFAFSEDCVIAVTGAGFKLYVQGQPMPLWMAISVRRGWQAYIEKVPGGNWGYLAVSGGIITEQVMGSRSTYLRGSFGGFQGRLLQAGDVLPTGRPPYSFIGLSGRQVPAQVLPAYSETPVLEVILGPQEERFPREGIETFFSHPYKVSITSDRMGYRLEGAAIPHLGGADILSDGMMFGSIQVPANGQPIVMMSEHPTTGGYTKIATVVSADLPVLAQCTPGKSQVRFKPTNVEAAQAKYRALFRGLQVNLLEPEDVNLAYIE
jgi:antagonist of KipI